MDKRRVDALIPRAYTILGELAIMGKCGSENKKWCGQIAAFGASVAQGSLLAAVSFFSAECGAGVKRERLMMAIWLLIDEKNSLDINLAPETDDEKKAYKDAAILLYKQVSKEKSSKNLKEEILHAAVALKLAMNLYDLDKGGKDDAGVSKNEFELSSEQCVL